MVRPRPIERVDGIFDAAERSFLAAGLSRTTMSTIARRAGVSEATLYYYFASKEALFLWTLVRAWDPNVALPATLPVDAPDGQSVDAVFGAARRGVVDYPRLAEAVRRPTPADRDGELRRLLAESFDSLTRHRRWIDLAHAAVRADTERAPRWMSETVGGPDNLWVKYFAARPEFAVDPWDAAVLVDVNLHYFARLRPARLGPPTAAQRATVVGTLARALVGA